MIGQMFHAPAPTPPRWAIVCIKGVAGLVRGRWIVTAFLLALGARLAFGACNSIPSKLVALRVAGLYGPHDRVMLERDADGRKFRRTASLECRGDGFGILSVNGARYELAVPAGCIPPFEVGDLRLLEALRANARAEGTPIAVPVGARRGTTLALRIAFVVRKPTGLAFVLPSSEQR